MWLKALLIATLIIGTKAFQFRRKLMPVLTHSALSATATMVGGGGASLDQSADFVRRPGQTPSLSL